MSQRDYALYCLLLTQSIEKTYRPLLSDSLIKTSLNYFKDNMDRKLLAQSYFYAGRANEEMKNVLKAIEYELSGFSSNSFIANNKLSSYLTVLSHDIKTHMTIVINIKPNKIFIVNNQVFFPSKDTIL